MSAPKKQKIGGRMARYYGAPRGGRHGGRMFGSTRPSFVDSDSDNDSDSDSDNDSDNDSDSKTAGKGVVYALVETTLSSDDGGESITSLHASKESAARAMRRQFDSHHASKYDEVMAKQKKPPSVKGEPLQNVEERYFCDVFEIRVNTSGNPIYINEVGYDGMRTDKMSIVAKTIQGPLAFHFDRDMLVTTIISVTGVTRVLADIIADYAVLPKVYLFEHSGYSYDDMSRSQTGPSTLYAADGGAAPPPKFCDEIIRDAICKSSELRDLVDGDIGAVLDSILGASNIAESPWIPSAKAAIINSIDSLSSVSFETKKNAASDALLIKEMEMMYHGGHKISEEFKFCKSANPFQTLRLHY
jgi:hypothetical protein